MQSPSKPQRHTRRRRDCPFEIAILVENPANPAPVLSYLRSQEIPNSKIHFFSKEEQKHFIRVPSFHIDILHIFFSHFFKPDTRYVVLHESILGFLEHTEASYSKITSFTHFIQNGFTLCTQQGAYCWTVESDWRKLSNVPQLRWSETVTDMWASVNIEKPGRIYKLLSVAYVK